MVDDARRLYLKYGGRRIAEIEREMRALGHRFHRRHLYTTRHSHGVTPGWPERYGWRKLLKPADRARLGHRSRGRNRFEKWLRENFPTMKWGFRHQRYLYEKLWRITTGQCTRLMIFMPPRHGKTELVTIRYTAWRVLDDPTMNVILAGHTQKLADKFSRRIKRICKSDAFRHSTAAPTTDPQTKTPKGLTLTNTASEWETPAGGTVRAVGVGGGIAGFGARLIIIDDPIRNRADAESESHRDRLWDWFNDDIHTRMEKNCSIILIQTRWHEDDLAGRLIREMQNGGEKWEVVSLPALSEPPASAGGQFVGPHSHRVESEQVEPTNKRSPRLRASAVKKDEDPLGRKPGQPLCPQMFSEKALKRIQKKLGTYSFSALYQQRPAPAEGGQFKRVWFKQIVDAAPPNLKWKRGYDLAISTKTTADYTASFRCARDRKTGIIYIADGYRARLEYPDQRRYILERMRAETDTEHGIESSMHGKAIIQDLRRDYRTGRFAFREVRVTGDKLTRALAWLNLAEEGKIILVRGPWIDDFIDEIARFPTGRHDDQIDAVSVAVQMIHLYPGPNMWVF